MPTEVLNPVDIVTPIHESLIGDARNLKRLKKHFPTTGFNVIITSPPYWQRRDYGHPDQLGQEKTPELFIKALSRTVQSWEGFIAPKGSVFINLADTYLDGFLVGIPSMFEQSMLLKGWKLAHRIIWSKATSVPQPTRLASRHEVVLQFVPPKNKGYYFDRFALTNQMPEAEIGDVWHLSPKRSSSGHPAPFPSELVERILLISCPPKVCQTCNTPFQRMVAPSPLLDISRPQAVRAMEKFAAAGLTEEHLEAIRAVGISDTGMGKRLQKGSGLNTARKQVLADEAKAALGGYFREFTFAPRQHAGWKRCDCDAPVRPGFVLDPFTGSNTTILAAKKLGFNAIGVDLNPHQL